MPEDPQPDVKLTVGETYLGIVKYMGLVGKSGPTGSVLDLAFSRREGFLVGVTEFHYLNAILKGWGMQSTGSGGAFKSLDLYPEVSFTRKTLRKTLREDPKFSRAMSITASLAYMYHNYFDIEPEKKIELPELYKAVQAAGFDWTKILEDTVEYWYFEDQADEINKPTVTARTILGMGTGEFDSKHVILKKLAA